MTPQLIAVLIGIAGALFGVYLREAIRSALRMKSVAYRIEAHLSGWMAESISGSFRNVLVRAVVIANKQSEAYRTGGREAWERAREEGEKSIQDMADSIKRGENEIDRGIDELWNNVRAMPEETFRGHINQLERHMVWLVEGTAFVSDAEAAELSWVAAHRAIAIKNHLSTVLYQLVILMRVCRYASGKSYTDLREGVAEVAVRLVRYYTEVNPLLEHASAVRRSSLLKLTLKQVFT